MQRRTNHVGKTRRLLPVLVSVFFSLLMLQGGCGSSGSPTPASSNGGTSSAESGVTITGTVEAPVSTTTSVSIGQSVNHGISASKSVSKGATAEENGPRVIVSKAVSDLPVSSGTVTAKTPSGTTLVNDISAGQFDSEMLPLVSRSKVRICLMHMQGTPETMQKNPRYKNVVEEVKVFLTKRMTACLEAGIEKEKIVLDPGIGFGKSVEDNLALLKNLDQFQDLGCPILIGTSRKSFIGALTGANASDRLPGSLATVAVAVQKGAQMVRVHDVAETKQFLSLFSQLHK